MDPIEIDIRTLYEFAGRPVPDAPPGLPEVEALVREPFLTALQMHEAMRGGGDT